MKIEKTIKKLYRKFQLSMLEKATPDGLLRLGEKKLLQHFQNAHNASPALKEMLQKQRITSLSVKTIEQFSNLNFYMEKENTFNKYPLDDLCRPNTLDNLMSVLTSSGHSGNFAFGLTTWAQGKRTPDLLDMALENAFQIDEKKTLLINCLPMGVRFPSNSVTQAEVSVREDMALSLINKFSPYYDQIIIVCDPLFLKLLLDEAPKWNVDWKKIHNNLIIGEESIGENFRNYVGNKMNINPDDTATGIIGSSMGAGELGLNICFETVETIALRRYILHSKKLKQSLFGCHDDHDPLPMFFAYNPLANYIEIKNPNEDGYGDLMISILDQKCPIPLFRYLTGDEARLLSTEEITVAFQGLGLPTPQLPKMPLICIRGRQSDRIASGIHIGTVKDALYQDIDFADQISGAFRIDYKNQETLHIQLRRHIDHNSIQAPDICSDKTVLFSKENVKLWNYDSFPFGMTIDYERKFSYLA